MGRPLLFASIVAVALADGQFTIPVFADMAAGHWETDGPPLPLDPNIDGQGLHSYAHHDHGHIHDHSNEHHPHDEHHDHHHHLAMNGDVLHHCEGDGTTQREESACTCHQHNGLFQSICDAGQFCDTFTGRCQRRSCFDACLAASPDDEAVRNTCYTETCSCPIDDDGGSNPGKLSEEEKCQLDCADCSPFPMEWPASAEHKAAKHENVMQDIFGSGLEHASDYNLRGVNPMETLSNIMF